MFTGIVEETGRVVRTPAPGRAGQLVIAAQRVLEGSRIGDSIAVNGVCLTATSIAPGSFAADVMPQTLSHSNLGALRAGSAVNLERAMAANGRFGGHIVSGHIDGTGTVRRVKRDQNAVRYTIEASADILALMVLRGSITVDGISLTVANLFADAFEVSVIPHTAAATTLGSARPGSIVNLENDVVGKYVQRLLYNNSAPTAVNTSRNAAEPRTNAPTSPPLTLDFLAAHGF